MTRTILGTIVGLALGLALAFGSLGQMLIVALFPGKPVLRGEKGKSDHVAEPRAGAESDTGQDAYCDGQQRAARHRVSVLACW